jgi:hypothetical protein
MNIQTLKDRNNDLERLKVQFDREEIEEFARWHWKKGKRANRWNGRQIKNAFQTAISLAHCDSLEDGNTNKGPELKTAHFKKVSKVSMHFDKYPSNTRRDDDVIAKELGVRDDDIPEEFQLESDCEEDEPKRSKRKTSKTDKTKTIVKEKKSVKVESNSKFGSKSRSKKKRRYSESSESSSSPGEESSQSSLRKEHESENSDESK